MRIALLEAATQEYAAGGAFSVRDVARRACVNHGQIHHIFGGKQGLTRAMLAHLGGLQAQTVPEGAGSEEVIAAAAAAALADARFVRVLARRLLEEPDEPMFQERFPVVERLLATLAEHGVEDGAVLVGDGLARALGWAFFGPWIRQAAQLDDDACARIESAIAAPTKA